MFIGHYKSVNSPEEFFSSIRESLDFPTQVEFNGKRYLLNATHHADTKSQLANIESYAKSNGISCGVNV